MSPLRVLPSLLISLSVAAALPARGAEEPAPRQRVGADPVKARAQEAERQRLIAKLHAEVPKVNDAPPPSQALAAPIFHRYERR
jgi:hypothetical protein